MLPIYPGQRTDCGHLFCLECILDWLSAQLSDFQARNPGFTLTENTIDVLKDPLSNPDGFVEAVKTVKLRYPQFTCPVCRSAIKRRPIQSVIMEYVSTDLCAPGRGDAEVAPPLQHDLSQVNRRFEPYLLF